jgi:hypothetical protein
MGSFVIEIWGVFGWERKVKGKNVKGKKINGKWVESEMIFRLFGLSESERKERFIVIEWHKYPYIKKIYYI